MANKQDFLNCVDFLKKKSPELKIKITNKTMTDGCADGEYCDNEIEIAIKRKSWDYLIGVLLHEYAHHLIHNKIMKSKGKREANKVYYAGGALYSPKEKYETKVAAAKIVLLDEYYADCLAHKLAKKLGFTNTVRDWWYQTNTYNYIIKYFLETGILVEDFANNIRAPNRRFSKKEILQPLSKYKKNEIDGLLKKKKIMKLNLKEV